MSFNQEFLSESLVSLSTSKSLMSCTVKLEITCRFLLRPMELEQIVLYIDLVVMALNQC